MDIRQLACCGVAELNGISYHGDQPSLNIESVKSLLRTNRHYSQLIFTQAHSQRRPTTLSYGHKLAHYIEDNNLGTVSASTPQKNPNTGNFITTFVWTPNYSNLLKAKKTTSSTSKPRSRRPRL